MTLDFLQKLGKGKRLKGKGEREKEAINPPFLLSCIPNTSKSPFCSLEEKGMQGNWVKEFFSLSPFTFNLSPFP
jgi:hypothetical protein